MNHKVLLADDSLTIQKVIKITLANQPYDITDCSNEEELFHQLPIIQPKLVFLDFNLSEKFTGYELTTKIKSILPTTKVLLLLGTFDTVDDAAMEKCGASDKIVKPFDSNKFIAICKQLIETFATDEEISYPETKPEPKATLPSSPDDQWTMSHSTEQKFKAPEKPLDDSFPNLQNALDKEASEWGMSVPGVINDHEAHNKVIDLPPIITEEKSVKDKKPVRSEFETKFPASEDLDYPTMENLVASEDKKEAKSKLIPIDSFKESKNDEFVIQNSYVEDEADISSIEAQIRDEVENDLWQADEFEDLKKEVSAKIEEVKSNFQPSRQDFDESLFKPLDEKESIDWNESNDFFKPEANESMASFDRSELETLVKKYVKEYMDEMFQQKVEKVAWDVIPDLAENLIRQELSKIAGKILND